MRDILAGMVCVLVLVLGPAAIAADPAGDAAGPSANQDGTPDGASVINPTLKAWTLTAVRGATRSSHEIKPGERLFGLCPSGCILRLEGADDNDYVIEGNERLAIDNDAIYYDDAPDGMRQLLPAAPR